MPYFELQPGVSVKADRLDVFALAGRTYMKEKKSAKSQGNKPRDAYICEV